MVAYRQPVIIEPRPRPLDRRQLLRWLARASAGVAGLGLLGCGGGDGMPGDGHDAAPGGDGGTCAPTTSDVLGPYYRPGAPSRMTIASATEPGERLILEGVVLGPDCAPLAGAVIDVWQADQDGRYYEPTGVEPYRLRGKLATAADGSWQLATIRPGNYKLDATLWRPAHVHVTVTQPGFRSLTTQLYFEGDPFLPPNDGCTTCGSDDPARILRLVPAMTGMRGELQLVLG